jgi:hypothetical protein
MSEPAGFTHLDDPAFLRARSCLHRRLEDLPENTGGRAELELLYETMTQEFLRRARIAWTSAPGTAEGRAIR